MRADYVVVISPDKKFYSGCPDNRESATSIEAINAAGDHIPPIIIMSGINIYLKWFVNDLHEETQITTSESGYSDDWISLQ